MSLAITGAKALDKLGAALHGLDAIADLANSKFHGADRAMELLSIIASIVDHLRDGFNDKVDVSAIHQSLLKLRTDLMEHDRDAESALDKKFPR